jgi:NAD(P)H dehydrogenase (quinone)
MEKMTISVILAHANRKSFNHAIAMRVLETIDRLGYRAFFHDLYEEGFDPMLSGKELAENKLRNPLVARHCREIASAEGIVIIHPNWWGQPPAILKGWIDRVLREGVAYRFQKGDSGAGVPIGLLRAEAAVVFNTSNTPLDRERKVFGDPLDKIWKRCVFSFCGVKKVCRKTFCTIAGSDLSTRKKWLDETGSLVQETFGKQV